MCRRCMRVAYRTETNPETMEETPVTYYRTIAGFPKDYNFVKFPYESVLREGIDEKYIF